MSRDLIDERGGANRYQYVDNSPMGNRDPLGLWKYPDYLPMDPLVTTELFTLDFVALNYPNNTGMRECVRNEMQHMLAGAYLTGMMGQSTKTVMGLGVAWEGFEIVSSKMGIEATKDNPLLGGLNKYYRRELNTSLSDDTLIDLINDYRGAEIGNKLGGDLSGIIDSIADKAACDCGNKK